MSGPCCGAGRAEWLFLTCALGAVPGCTVRFGHAVHVRPKVTTAARRVGLEQEYWPCQGSNMVNTRSYLLGGCSTRWLTGRELRIGSTPSTSGRKWTCQSTSSLLGNRWRGQDRRSSLRSLLRGVSAAQWTRARLSNQCEPGGTNSWLSMEHCPARGDRDCRPIGAPVEYGQSGAHDRPYSPSMTRRARRSQNERVVWSQGAGEHSEYCPVLFGDQSTG